MLDLFNNLDNYFTNLFDMNKIEKIYRRLFPQGKPKEFTRERYLEILHFWKEHIGFISFQDIEGLGGLILRHDIDKDLDAAVRMAELEAGIDGNLNRAMFEHGNHPVCRSTYFVLNTRTSGYWGSDGMEDALLYIEELGHEVGWHNNAITEHIETGKPILSCIRDPLDQLRGLGLKITGSAAHGDRLCKKLGYMNYNVFGFRSRGWKYWDSHEVTNMKDDFDLDYEAYHVPYDNYLADGYQGWNTENISNPMIYPSWCKRTQVLIHPHLWRI
jgi:hypothetical protein